MHSAIFLFFFDSNFKQGLPPDNTQNESLIFKYTVFSSSNPRDGITVIADGKPVHFFGSQAFFCQGDVNWRSTFDFQHDACTISWRS